jgi:hypothetical protein
MARMLLGLSWQGTPKVLLLLLGIYGNASPLALVARQFDVRVVLFCQEVLFREIKFLNVWKRIDSLLVLGHAAQISLGSDPHAVLAAEKICY